jgi:4'-phosphopantetheinyl transferase
MVALAAGREIGIDVEYVRDDLELDGISANFFSLREQAKWRMLPACEKPGAFLRCWTRKEAFIKARGEGLSLPLHQFDVSLRLGERPILLATRPDPTEAGRWSIQDLAVGLCYHAAIAVEGLNWRLKTFAWRPEECDV